MARPNRIQDPAKDHLTDPPTVDADNPNLHVTDVDGVVAWRPVPTPDDAENFIPVGATGASLLPGSNYDIRSQLVQSIDDGGTPGDTSDDIVTYANITLPDDTQDGRETRIKLTIPFGGRALINCRAFRPQTGVIDPATGVVDPAEGTVDPTGIYLTLVGEITSFIWDSVASAYRVSKYTKEYTSGVNDNVERVLNEGAIEFGADDNKPTTDIATLSRVGDVLKVPPIVKTVGDNLLIQRERLDGSGLVTVIGLFNDDIFIGAAGLLPVGKNAFYRSPGDHEFRSRDNVKRVSMVDGTGWMGIGHNTPNNTPSESPPREALDVFGNVRADLFIPEVNTTAALTDALAALKEGALSYDSDKGLPVYSDGTKFQTLGERLVRQVRPEQYEGATVRDQFIAMIADINTRGGTGDVPGWEILLDGDYDLVTGLPSHPITVDHVYIVASSRGNARITWASGDLFVWGGTRSAGALIVQGGGIVNGLYQYTGNDTATLMTSNHATDMLFVGTRLKGIGRAILCDGRNENISSNILISGNTGHGANVPIALIETCSDALGGICAGIRIEDNNIFNQDVAVPDVTDPNDVSTAVLGRHFILIDGKIDTANIRWNISNRFDISCFIRSNVIDGGTSIIKFIQNTCDYAKTAGVKISQGGGNVNHIEINDNWLNAQDGHCIELLSTSAAGLFQDIEMNGNRAVHTGRSMYQLSQKARDVRIGRIKVRGIGRNIGDGVITSAYVVAVPAGTQEFSITGPVSVEDVTEETGKALLPTQLITVGADCDNYDISGFRVDGPADVSILNNTSGSRKRRVAGLIGSNLHGKETFYTGASLPATGVAVENTTPFNKQVAISGTITSLQVNTGVAWRIVPHGGSFNIGPGDSWRINYTGAGTGVVVLEQVIMS